MDSMGQSFGSSSSSGASAGGSRIGGRVICHCGKDAVILKSWTDENPGRRFYRCPQFQTPDRCRFFQWYDNERVTGWPKDALIQARNEIREKNAEVRWFRERLESVQRGSQNAELNSASQSSIRDEIKALEGDIDRWKEERAMLKSENSRMKRRCTKLKGKKSMLIVSLIVSWFMFGFVAVYVAWIVA